jgi:hypothetical protein
MERWVRRVAAPQRPPERVVEKLEKLELLLLLLPA